MIALTSVLYFGIQNLTKDYVISRLQHDIDSLVAALEKSPDGLWVIPNNRISNVYNRVQSGHYYLVSVNKQQLRSRSLFDTEIEPLYKELNSCQIIKATNKEKWMSCSQQIIKQESTLIIWIAEDISPIEQAQHRFIAFAIGAIIFTIIILLLMQYHILKQGFSQLGKIQESIKQMHLGTENISTQNLPIEILPLIQEINRLLIQLSNRAQRSRNALGNLAHALKRPLQRYHSQLEKLDNKQYQENLPIFQEINNVIECELKRARIVGAATPGRHVVINEDLPHLIKIMQSIYPNKIIEAKYIHSLVLPHDRDDILELLGNLLDNACKHAHLRILLTLQTIDQGWTITVEDDGDGVTEDALEIISERGVRMDESTQGHGLGLSICKNIALSYFGELSFKKSKLGGLAASIFLPKTKDIY